MRPCPPPPQPASPEQWDFLSCACNQQNHYMLPASCRIPGCLLLHLLPELGGYRKEGCEFDPSPLLSIFFINVSKVKFFSLSCLDCHLNTYIPQTSTLSGLTCSLCELSCCCFIVRIKKHTNNCHHCEHMASRVITPVYLCLLSGLYHRLESS
jgi:hypothetical protein